MNIIKNCVATDNENQYTCNTLQSSNQNADILKKLQCLRKLVVKVFYIFSVNIQCSVASDVNDIFCP